LGQASETDTATPVLGSKNLTLGQATESDTSQPVTPTRGDFTLGQAQETDTARQLIIVKTVTLGPAFETDTAGAVTVSKDTLTLGQAEEVDEALPLILPNQGPPPPSPTDQVCTIYICSTPTTEVELPGDETVILASSTSTVLLSL